VYKPADDTSFFVNLSHTERAPAPTELFAQGPHDASKTFEFGDPNLHAEKALSVEGGIKHERSDGSNASFTLYRTAFSGFIDGFLTGNTCNDTGTCGFPGPGDFNQLFYIQRDATYWGFEGQVHWHVFDIGTGRAGFDLQTDYVRATLSGGGNVPRIPPLRYGGGFFYESSLMALRLSVLHADAQNKIEAHETPTPGYTNVDASATFHLVQGETGDWDLSVVGTNLTDARERNAVAFTKGFVLQPGRTFKVMLHYIR
jgi:iron complex outermembrane receptor protein